MSRTDDTRTRWRHAALVVGCCAASSLVGCLPILRATLVVPIARVAGAQGGHADAVDLPIAELASRMRDFDAEAVAVYVEGREPWPFVQVVRDAAGSPIALRVHGLDALDPLPAGPDGAARDLEIVVVSPHPPVTVAATDPAPTSTAKPNAPRPRTGTLEANFSRARR